MDAAQDRPTAETPLLSYRLVTRHPTKRGNLRVEVDRDGGVRAQRNDADPPAGQDWVADLPDQPSATVPDAPTRLHDVLEDGGFFAMAEHQVNEAVSDGTVRELRWNGAGGPRTVTVDRARSPEFDQLVGALSRVVGVAGM